MASSGSGSQQQLLASVLSKWQESMKPLGGTLSRGFTQYQQYVRERMGAAGDVTELPAEYRDLEEKVDKIKALHDNFLKVTRTYTLPHYDYEPPLGDSVTDFATQFEANARSVVVAGAKAAGVGDQVSRAVGGAGAEPASDIPKSLSHALARVALQTAKQLGTDEPLGAALNKFAAIHERVGNGRLKMDADIIAKFFQPFNTTLNQTIAHAMKARRNVLSARLNYDAARARLKSAKPDKIEATRGEMELAEDEFVAAVDDAMGKMKIVVESPEPLKNLADLCAAQLAYFKEAYEALAELSPEIDELQVTNEALMRR